MADVSPYAPYAVQFVNEGHGTFMAKSETLLDKSLEYVQSLAAFAPTLTSFNISFDFNEQLTPFQRPTTPTINETDFNLRAQENPGVPADFDPQTPDLGAAPTFEHQAPSLAFGPKPDRPDIATPVSPGRPAQVVVPATPNYQAHIPEKVSLLSLNLPVFPTLALPTFNSPRPSLEPFNINENWSFTPEAYTSTMLDDLKSQIGVWLQGQQALPAAIERALFDRGRARVVQETQALEEQAFDDFAARGFSQPPGMLAARVDAIRQDAQNKTAEFNREVTIKAYEEALTNLRLAVQQGTALEGVAINLHLEEQRMLLQSSQFLRETAIAVLNAKIAHYNGALQGYQTDAQVFRDRIQGELAKLEETRVKLEGEKLKGEVNEQTVRQYAEQWNAVRTMADFYRSQIEGVKVQADINRIPLELFAKECEAFETLWSAHAKEWDGYRAGAEAEAVKGQLFNTLAGAFASETQAYATQGQLKIGREQLRLQQHGQKLQTYDASLRRLGLLLETERARLAAAGQKADAKATIFRAQADVEQAASASADRSFQLGLEKAKTAADFQMETARIRSAENVQLQGYLLEALKAIAQIMSQLSASSMAAMSYSASVSAGANDSVSRGVAWNGEAPDYTGLTFF